MHSVHCLSTRPSELNVLLRKTDLLSQGLQLYDYSLYLELLNTGKQDYCNSWPASDFNLTPSVSICLLRAFWTQSGAHIAWKSKKRLGNKWSLHLTWLHRSQRISDDISSLIWPHPRQWESNTVFHGGMTDHDSGGECRKMCEAEPSWGKCQPTNITIEAIRRWTHHQ